MGSCGLQTPVDRQPCKMLQRRKLLFLVQRRPQKDVRVHASPGVDPNLSLVSQLTVLAPFRVLFATAAFYSVFRRIYVILYQTNHTLEQRHQWCQPWFCIQPELTTNIMQTHTGWTPVRLDAEREEEPGIG